MGSTGECGAKDELRAILVKAGALLAPTCFKVALGDEKCARETTQDKEASDVSEEEVENAKRDDIGEEREQDNDEGGKTSGLGSENLTEFAAVSSSLGSDSEYSGIVRPDVKEGEGMRSVGVEEGGESREKWHRVVKEQVEEHAKRVGTEYEVERSVFVWLLQ